MKRFPSAEQIRQRVADRAFGQRLIVNVHRSLVAEAIVAAALEPNWRWCSADYASRDFDRADGVRLEVKQSAARQSWTTDQPSACSFDIASRSGRYEEGTRWIDSPGRNADIYVFAHHPLFGDEADHCDPAQWQFYVVPTGSLPEGKRIGLGRLRALTLPVNFAELRERVDAAATALNWSHPGEGRDP
jgi:hypothetical protein